jgi:hypothetical protein
MSADFYTGWNDDSPDLTDTLFEWDKDVVTVLASSSYIIPTRAHDRENDYIHANNMIDNNLYKIWLSETNPTTGVWVEIDLGVPRQRLDPDNEAAQLTWSEEAHERFPGPDGEPEGFTGFNILYMEIFWAGWTAPREYKVWAWRDMDADDPGKKLRIHKTNQKTAFQRLDTLPGWGEDLALTQSLAGASVGSPSARRAQTRFVKIEMLEIAACREEAACATPRGRRTYTERYQYGIREIKIYGRTPNAAPRLGAASPVAVALAAVAAAMVAFGFRD